MPKYKILKRFHGIEEEQTFEVGSEIELTSKRAKEITDKLGDGFLKVIRKPSKKESE